MMRRGDTVKVKGHGKCEVIFVDPHSDLVAVEDNEHKVQEVPKSWCEEV